jgi:hypothetical protein
MTIYLSNADVHPTGLEPAEFLDIPSMGDTSPGGPLTASRTDGAPNGRRGRALDEDPSATPASDSRLPAPLGDQRGATPAAASRPREGA